MHPSRGGPLAPQPSSHLESQEDEPIARRRPPSLLRWLHLRSGATVSYPALVYLVFAFCALTAAGIGHLCGTKAPFAAAPPPAGATTMAAAARLGVAWLGAESTLLPGGIPVLLFVVDIGALVSFSVLRYSKPQSGLLQRGERRPRSALCPVTGESIRLGDHYSDLAGQCIGAGNMLAFAMSLLLFTWAFAANALWSLWVLLRCDGLFAAGLALVAAGLVSLSGAVWAAKTLGITVRRWLVGLTATEVDRLAAASGGSGGLAEALKGRRPRGQNLQAFLISPHKLDR